MRNLAPSFFVKGYRLLRYKPERRRFWREVGLKRKQDAILKRETSPGTKNLVLFIVPGLDPNSGREKISGGVISIVSLCEETKQLFKDQQVETLLCTFGQDALLLKHLNFENSTWVFRLPQAVRHFRNLEKLTLHIPEFLVEYFMDQVSPAEISWMESIDKVHINILNQNIRLMPEPDVIRKLGKFTSYLTITTAHQKYCTPYYRELYGVPIHKLSVWISPEQYWLTEWEAKESLMVVSPDPHPEKDAILELLQNIPGLSIRIIENLSYTDYKKLISTAKWSLTFGEGLDGYFIEPVFSGAISFAVYNEQFFTADFKKFDTVYSSMNELKESIVSDISRLDNSENFKSLQKSQFELCSFYYSKEQYRRNIAAFYSSEYTYA